MFLFYFGLIKSSLTSVRRDMAHFYNSITSYNINICLI